jgi:hypothetical protein
VLKIQKGAILKEVEILSRNFFGQAEKSHEEQ